jgi:hypothetical protein
MIKLKSHEVCALFNDCEYRVDFTDGFSKGLCKGGDPDRDNVFICDFYIEKRCCCRNYCKIEK